MQWARISDNKLQIRSVTVLSLSLLLSPWLGCTYLERTSAGQGMQLHAFWYGSHRADGLQRGFAVPWQELLSFEPAAMIIGALLRESRGAAAGGGEIFVCE